MRVVLCDDHRLLLDALEVALTSRGHEVVATVTTPTDAERALGEHHPDICLLDLNFPEGTSSSRLADLVRRSQNTRFVMLSATCDPSAVLEALTAGAAGYIPKTTSIDEICTMMERALAGQVAVDPTLLHRALNPRQNSRDPLFALQFLTDREWDVLKCIVDGLSTEAMATALGVKPSTARTHVQSLLTKLGVHSRLQASALIANHATEKHWPPRLR